MKQQATSYDITTGLRSDVPKEVLDFKKPGRSQIKENKLKLVQFLNVGRMKKTYYLSEAEVSVETIEVITKFAFGTDKDVEFLSNAILHARESGHMRSVPILALAILSSSPTQLAKTNFRKLFPRIIKTGNDLKEFVGIIKSNAFRGFGKSVQNACKEWFYSMTPYDAIKYGSRNRTRDDGDPSDRIDSFTLGDIIKLCHVKPRNARENGLFKWLMGVDIEGRPVPEQILAYEKFKTLQDGDPERAKLVQENGLPYEVISSLSEDKEVWKQLCLHAPFMNLIRNLRNYYKRGLFDDQECLDHVCDVIGDPERVERSGMFPFQFVSAFDEMIEGPVEILEVLEDAIESSYASLPDIKKKVAIIVDQSSSMAHSKVSPKSSVSIQTVANTFAAILYKKTKESYMIPFANKAEIALIPKKTSTLNIATDLVKMNVGHETSLSAPFKKMVKENLKVDVIIAITDNNSWLDELRNTSAGDVLSEYLNNVNPAVTTFFVNTEIGRATPVDHRLPNTCFLYGWSSNIIKYILEDIQEQKDPLKEIENIKL